jgi:N-acetylglutamate synthase-like GNAT family acetyltransferase
MNHKYHLRPANAGDMLAIRSLIYQTGINPMGLDWRRFILAVDSRDQVIGCGQIKPHRDGTRELASIAVRPGWRRQGVASAIIERMLDENPGTLYLTCREHLGPFYARFGFQVIDTSRMPAFLHQATKFFGLLKRLGVVKEGLLVMQRTEEAWIPTAVQQIDVLANHRSTPT